MKVVQIVVYCILSKTLNMKYPACKIFIICVGVYTVDVKLIDKDEQESMSL